MGRSSICLIVLASLVVATGKAAEPFDYMAELRARETAVESAGEDVGKRRFALQMLATAQSWVGDTEGAKASFQAAMRLNSSTPLSKAGADIDAFLASHEVRDALAAIVEQARRRQIVMINEAHHVPRDRAFATLVALELRKLGFDYLAMETLGKNYASIEARGYQTTDEYEGYYSREPVFGDFLRQGVRAGYRLVRYEHTSDDDEQDPARRDDAREEGQARNLARILEGNPRARLLVHVGYGHLQKGPVDAGAGKTRLVMAERLKAITGIDPFCIDQARNDPTGPAMDAILEKTHFESFVLRKPGAEYPYSETSTVDMFVYHRPVRLLQGRPHWLAMDGYRRPRRIPVKLLPAQGRRLIQAFVAGESADAVPVDQVVVTTGQPVPVFMLPKGRFRFGYQD
jgi:hypothetical protein